ncbi:MAG: hypothetical protein LQ352_004455 [Teloschistes flavicans]|nr:MAG: hypothetical protein LQ352_004455 [Teloschistes flavicans]
MRITSTAGACLVLVCPSLVSSRPLGDFTSTLALGGEAAESIKGAVGHINITLIKAGGSDSRGVKGIEYLGQSENKLVKSLESREPVIYDRPTKGIKYAAQDRNPLVEATLSPRHLNISKVDFEGYKYLAQSQNAAVRGGKLVRRLLGARHQRDTEVLEPRKLNITKVHFTGYKYFAQEANAAVRGGKLLRRYLGSGHQHNTEVLEPRKLNVTEVHLTGYKYFAQEANAAVREEKREASPEPIPQPEAAPQPVPAPEADLQ